MNMLLRTLFVVAFLAFEGRALSIPKRRADVTSPTVYLPYGSYQGGLEPDGKVQHFLGIDYAKPPVGDLRLRQPVQPDSFKTTKQAVVFGASCPQQNYTLTEVKDIDYTPLEGLPTKVKPSEDCLYLNIFRPANVSENDKLPVVVWIYGGGFLMGDASAFNASSLVVRSQELKQPVIYVSFNYRLNGFGFLGGKEVADAGLANLGLLDQRMALEWVQQYISSFGGDPRRVTLWGQSAGSVSVASHIITNPGKNNTLFNGAIMHSTSTSPIVDTTHPKQQSSYDTMVDLTGCTGQNDTLSCLRNAPFDSLMSAINSLPSVFSDHGLNLTFSPSVDGKFFNKTMKEYVREGHYAQVPVIYGTTDDEGTLFSLAMMENVTTEGEVSDLIKNLYLPTANDTVMQTVLQMYPADIDLGSPFDTPEFEYEYPQFKRLAAFQGDFINEAARRSFLTAVSQTQNAWSFLWKRGKNHKYLGSVHTGELPEFYNNDADIEDNVATDLVVNFINTGNPNLPKTLVGQTNSLMSNVSWPLWNSKPEEPPMFLFSDDPTATYGFVQDTYRASQISYLEQLQVEMGV
jgi:carboxylesterase type B